MKRIAVFAFAAVVASTSAHAEGYSKKKTWRTNWAMICEPRDGSAPYAIIWDSPRKTLTTMSKRGVTRDYPGIGTPRRHGFEVFAARADQDRTLHAIFDDRAGMLIVTGDKGGADHCNILWD